MCPGSAHGLAGAAVSVKVKPESRSWPQQATAPGRVSRRRRCPWRRPQMAADEGGRMFFRVAYVFDVRQTDKLPEVGDETP